MSAVQNTAIYIIHTMCYDGCKVTAVLNVTVGFVHRNQQSLPDILLIYWGHPRFCGALTGDPPLHETSSSLVQDQPSRLLELAAGGWTYAGAPYLPDNHLCGWSELCPLHARYEAIGARPENHPHIYTEAAPETSRTVKKYWIEKEQSAVSHQPYNNNCARSSPKYTEISDTR